MRFQLAIAVLLLSACQTIHFSKNPTVGVPQIPIPRQTVPFALVLGGGGARGLAHVGVLEELEVAGLKPDIIVGCSAGAIVGVLYAARPDIKWLKQILLERQVDEFLDFALKDLPYGVSTNTKLRDFLDKHIPNKRFEDLEIPFIAVATNLQTGELTPFFTGLVTSPILASSAVPGVFRPVEMYGTYFVDGGVADPVPVQTARLLKAKTVVAVEIGQALATEAPNNIFEVVWRSLAINYLALSKKNVQMADVPIDVPLGNISMFSTKRNFDMYVLGRIEAAKALPKIKKLLSTKTKPVSSTPRRH